MSRIEDTDSYWLLKYAIVNATIADIRINVGVLLTIIYLSIPSLSQAGIKIKAPPIARVAPISPAIKPAS
jgi:hypothetical protein